jgi:hypothetical protein
MSNSDQLGRRCTIEPHSSGLHVCRRFSNIRACLKNYASLAACLGQLSLSLFLWSTARRRPCDTWQYRSSPLRKAEPRAVDTWQHRSSPLRKVEPRAMGHVAAPELTSSRRQCLELRDTWQRRSSPQQGGEIQGRGTRGGVGAHLCTEVWSEATAYAAACGCAPYSLS